MANLYPIDPSRFPVHRVYGNLQTLSFVALQQSGDLHSVQDVLVREGEWHYVMLNNEEQLQRFCQLTGLPLMPVLSYPSEIVVGSSSRYVVYHSPIPAAMPLDDWLTVIRLETLACGTPVYLPLFSVGLALTVLNAHRYPDLYQQALQNSELDPRRFLCDQAERFVSLVERSRTLNVYPF
jgi:hypothetical protein